MPCILLKNERAFCLNYTATYLKKNIQMNKVVKRELEKNRKFVEKKIYKKVYEFTKDIEENPSTSQYFQFTSCFLYLHTIKPQRQRASSLANVSLNDKRKERRKQDQDGQKTKASKSGQLLGRVG